MKKVKKKLTQEDFDKVICFLNEMPEGQIFSLTDYDMSGLILQNIDFSNFELRHCDLSNTVIKNSQFVEATLFKCNFSKSVIINSNFRNVYVSKSNFCKAKIRDTTFVESIINFSNFRFTEIAESDFSFSNLEHSNFSKTHFTNVKIYFADVSNTNFNKSKGVTHPLKCPESGSFTGYKKCVTYDNEYCIVELEIPADALRSSSTGNKCRCSKAKVISIMYYTGIPVKEGYARSFYDPSFIYWIGDTVEITDFDTNRWNECAPGIHFFMSGEEAVNYIG